MDYSVMRQAPQAASYPDPEDCILKFTASKSSIILPSFGCDFESLLQPTNSLGSSSREIIGKHQVSGCVRYKVPVSKKKLVHNDSDLMTKFYEHFMFDSELFNSIMRLNKLIITSTDEEKFYLEMISFAPTVGHAYTAKYKKVRPHCHISCRFLAAVCNSCNLQL